MNLKKQLMSYLKSILKKCNCNSGYLRYKTYFVKYPKNFQIYKNSGYSVHVDGLEFGSNNKNINKIKSILDSTTSQLICKLIDCNCESNFTQTLFTETLSKEIINPLNGLINTSHLLYNKSDDGQQKFADIIFECSYQIAEVIGEIFDFSKLGSENVKLVPTEFNLIEMVEQIKDSVLYRLDEKNVNLTIQHPIETSKLMVTYDKKWFKQLFVNLILFIHQYITDDDNNVYFKISQSQKNLKFEIIHEIQVDDIDEQKQQQQNMFQKFLTKNDIRIHIAKTIIFMMNGSTTILNINSPSQVTSVIEVLLPSTLKKQSHNSLKDMLIAQKSPIILIIHPDENIRNKIEQCFNQFMGDINVEMYKSIKLFVANFDENKSYNICFTKANRNTGTQLKKILKNAPLIGIQSKYSFFSNRDNMFEKIISYRVNCSNIQQIFEITVSEPQVKNFEQDKNINVMIIDHHKTNVEVIKNNMDKIIDVKNKNFIFMSKLAKVVGINFSKHKTYIIFIHLDLIKYKLLHNIFGGSNNTNIKIIAMTGHALNSAQKATLHKNNVVGILPLPINFKHLNFIINRLIN